MTDLDLDLDEYLRYGRQMIVPDMGLSSQLALKSSSVLVVGAGGLGSPAIAYLAGAGVGSITIVDGDTVEESNLHRQIIHSIATVGDYKSESAAKYVRTLNPHVKTTALTSHISNANVFKYMTNNAEGGKKKFDVVLDCTDNPATRYLVNDAAVLLGIPLVSASALKTEGQMALLNFMNGPCYRCFFPIPPPPNSVVACSDGGILGPVVGLMGVYQALEAIKIITGVYYITPIESNTINETNSSINNTNFNNGNSNNNSTNKTNLSNSSSSSSSSKPRQEFKPTLTIFSALSFPPWRCIKMRGKKSGCIACDESSRKISIESIESGEIDYAAFCGHVDFDSLNSSERVSVSNLRDAINGERDTNEQDGSNDIIIVDVRPEIHFGICHLPNSINIPLEKLNQMNAETLQSKLFGPNMGKEGKNKLLPPIYVICRFGNDSQPGTREIKNKLNHEDVHDVIGGLNAWSREIDNSFPRY